MTYTISTFSATLVTVLILWELFWKGLALWRSAQEDQRTWFILLLLINSAGLLSIVYLLRYHKHQSFGAHRPQVTTKTCHDRY